MALTPRSIMHPEDAAALDKLESLPLFTPLVKSFIKMFDERFLNRVTSLHYIRLGPGQLPEIHEVLVDVCQRLHLNVPQLYLEVHHEPFSYTLEAFYRYIIVSSSLLDKLSLEQIRVVFAHECGHIFFNHVLYRTMTKMLIRYGGELPKPMSTLSVPLRIALLYWYLRSELSADRVAAVITGDIRPVADTLFLTAETPADIVASLNLQKIVEQTASLASDQDSTIQRLMESLILSDNEHPFTTSRIEALLNWEKSPDWPNLLDNPSPECQHCHHPLHYDDSQCRHCGEINPEAIGINHSLNE